MIIGKFQNAQDGRITGTIDTVSGKVELTFTPNEKGADYTITTETGCEAGAAWKKTSRSDKAYISVRLDSPFLRMHLQPLLCFARLRPDKRHSLLGGIHATLYEMRSRHSR